MGGEGVRGGGGVGGGGEVVVEHRAEMANLHDEIEALQVGAKPESQTPKPGTAYRES